MKRLMDRIGKIFTVNFIFTKLHSEDKTIGEITLSFTDVVNHALIPLLHDSAF